MKCTNIYTCNALNTGPLLAIPLAKFHFVFNYTEYDSFYSRVTTSTNANCNLTATDDTDTGKVVAFKFM